MIVYAHPLLDPNKFMDKVFIDNKNKPIRASTVERVMNAGQPFTISAGAPRNEIFDLWMSAVRFLKDRGDGGVYFTTRYFPEQAELYDLFLSYSIDDTKAKMELLKEINQEEEFGADIRVGALIQNLRSIGFENRIKLVDFTDTLHSVFEVEPAVISNLRLTPKYVSVTYDRSMDQPGNEIIPSKSDVILGRSPDLMVVVDKPVTSQSEPPGQGVIVS